MTVKNQAEQIERLAKLLAAAYWRGRLDGMQRICGEEATFERMITAAAHEDLCRWRASAKLIFDDQ